MADLNASLSSEVLNNGVEVRGSVDNKIFVSVPEDMTLSSVEELAKKCKETFKNEVIITTHNIKFLKAVEIQ